MDPSLKQILTALQPGPATPRILVHTYGMTITESEQALTHAINQGLAEPIGPIAYQLTPDGQRLASEGLGRARRDGAAGVSAGLAARDRGLGVGDLGWLR